MPRRRRALALGAGRAALPARGAGHGRRGGRAPRRHASTWRRGVADRPAGQGDRGDAGHERRAHARADRARRSRRTGSTRSILVDDASSDDTRRAGPPPAAARGLAPPQRGLRRQPEDLLPRGAAARRRRRGDAAPRRPVRAGADRQHGRADPRRARPTWCSARGSRVPGHGARERHAALEVRGQPRAHGGREPDHGHASCPRPTPATAPTRAACC